MSKEPSPDVVEGNKLIAIFDGWQSNKYPNLPNKLHRIDTGQEVGIHINNLEYHSSWDWLVPAFHKFRAMRLSECDEGFNDAYSRHLVAVSNGIIHYNIEIAFERFVKALQWYNNQKLKP